MTTINNSLWDILPKTVHDKIYSYDATYRDKMNCVLDDVWSSSWIRYLRYLNKLNNITLLHQPSQAGRDVNDIITFIIKYFIDYPLSKNIYPDFNSINYAIIHNRIYGIFDIIVHYDNENIFKGTVIQNRLLENEETFMFYEEDLAFIYEDNVLGYSLYLRL